MMCAARNLEFDQCTITFAEMDALVARAIAENRVNLVKKLRALYLPRPEQLPQEWQRWDTSGWNDSPQVVGRSLSRIAAGWLMEMRGRS